MTGINERGGDDGNSPEWFVPLVPQFSTIIFFSLQNDYVYLYIYIYQLTFLYPIILYQGEGA